MASYPGERYMTAKADATSTNLAKFQSLLRDLFQFDCWLRATA